MLSNPQVGDHRTEILEFMTSLHKLLTMVINNACEEGSGLNSSQVKDLFKLGIIAIRCTQRIDRTLCQQIWQPDSWRALYVRLEASRFKSTPAIQKMCNQLVGLAQAVGPAPEYLTGTDTPVPGAVKRKAAHLPEEGEISQVKKPKRDAK